jgi:ribosomal protein S18 acetylase RimI-like enzyme
VEFRLATWNDADSLARAADSVFDHPVDAALAAEFLSDPRHHLAIAIEDGRIVGMASGVHYVHPDKAPELWINEVGVASGYQGRGVGRRVVRVLLDHGRALGCQEAWLLTDDSNAAARRMYAAAGGRETARQIMVSFDLREGHEST